MYGFLLHLHIRAFTISTVIISVVAAAAFTSISFVSFKRSSACWSHGLTTRNVRFIFFLLCFCCYFTVQYLTRCKKKFNQHCHPLRVRVLIFVFPSYILPFFWYYIRAERGEPPFVIMATFLRIYYVVCLEKTPERTNPKRMRGENTLRDVHLRSRVTTHFEVMSGYSGWRKHKKKRKGTRQAQNEMRNNKKRKKANKLMLTLSLK